MELDELKASWQRLDRRVQELGALNRVLLIDVAIRRARWRLAPIVAGAVANVVLGAFFAVVSARFWSAHLHSSLLLVPGVALHALSLVFVVIGIGRLVLARQIDFTRPVLEIQRSLASLQRWEAWSFHAAWVGCCLLPLSIIIAIATAAMGKQLWVRPPAWLLGNLLVWMVVTLCPLVTYAVSRRRRGRLAARMDAFLTSHSIARARATLDEIDDFARS
jgi:hypothetical protein